MVVKSAQTRDEETLLRFVNILSDQRMAELQEILFVAGELTVEDVRILYILTRAYIRHARMERPFWSATEIVKAVTTEAGMFRSEHGVPLVTRNRSQLFRKISNLLRVREGPFAFSPIIRGTHEEEIRTHPDLWERKETATPRYRRTWKKLTYFPSQIVVAGQVLGPEELEDFLAEIVLKPFEERSTYRRPEKTFLVGLFGEDGQRHPMPDDLRQAGYFILSKLVASPERLLRFYSRDDLEAELRKRAEVEMHGEISQ